MNGSTITDSVLAASGVTFFPAFGVFSGVGDFLRGTGQVLGGQPTRNMAAQQADSSEPGNFSGFGGQIYAAGAGADRLANASLKFSAIAVGVLLIGGAVYLYSRTKA